MGTRHLIAVQLDGQYRIAQYGQWDGYPSGQGETVLRFLDQMDRPAFEAKLRASRLLSKDELTALSEKFQREQTNWQRDYPHLSRDAGADILFMVQGAPDGIELKDSIDFAGDSRMCEYAYVIDLDHNVLDVFKGFNKEPLKEGERFKDSPRGNDYYPVRLSKTYSLSELPTVEQMEADVDPPEEDEEAA